MTFIAWYSRFLDNLDLLHKYARLDYPPPALVYIYWVRGVSPSALGNLREMIELDRVIAWTKGDPR